MSVVHVTPGLLDIRAFTILGLHAKPKTNAPIGKFGSGLKYAVAALLRLGCKVQVFIGETEYEFYTKLSDFRGGEFSQLMMKKRHPSLLSWRGHTTLPFTTEFGKFWKPWQAYRELESNTRDEGGETFFDVVVPARNWAKPDTTTIVVSGEPYEEAYRNRDQVFLPEALTKREGDENVQVFNEPSKHLYWRGIRIYDLDKPTIYTYNILSDIEITEDRTLKYMFQAHQAIAAFVAKSKDERFINAVVSAKDGQFEAKLDFDYAYTSPSAQFNEVMRKKRSRGSYVSSASLSYYTKYSPAPVPQAMGLKEQITEWAYNADVPEELQKLLKHLLRCEITEPKPVDPNDDGIPF